MDYLVALKDRDDRAKAIIDADYESLRGVLPKSEYQELDNTILGRILIYHMIRNSGAGRWARRGIDT